jgi:protein-disulfide isomerase
VEIMGKRLDTALSLVLTLAAVAMASAVVWRQFQPTSIRLGGIQKPEHYPGWRAWLANGTSMGGDSAPVVVVTFTDFECPVCARFHRTALQKTLAAFGHSVSATMVHFPLKIHRFSEVSAVAAECAADQGRFAEFVDVLFLKQDSLGLKSWESFAMEAGVPDRDSYQTCVEAQQPLERVKAGRALAEEIGITGTPTVFVNGWRLPGPLGETELSRAIQGVLDGEVPELESK